MNHICKYKTEKHKISGNMEENMCDLGFGNEFICRWPTLRDIKNQTDKLGFSNEKFCSSKNC